MNYNWFWIFANTKASLQSTGFKFELDFQQTGVTRSFADFNCYMSTYTAFERALWRKTIDCRYLHTGEKDTPLTKYNLSKAIFFVVHLESKAGSAGMIDIYVCTLYIEVGCFNFGQVRTSWRESNLQSFQMTQLHIGRIFKQMFGNNLERQERHGTSVWTESLFV